MPLITRIGKGSPLTFQEGDNNLTYLDNFIKQVSGSYATTGSNTFVGTQTVFGNFVVYGTSSISYTTSSTTNIGNNTITVNTNTPSVRFGGLIVFDSGSTNLSGSMLWDSINRYWVYQNPSGSNYNGGMLISGPKNLVALGQEQGTLLNVITKGQGEDHITSSALIEDGTNLRVAVSTIITGSLTVTSNIIGTGSYALNALTASYASNVPATASFAVFSQTASYALNVPATASYAANSNFLDGLDSTAFTLTSSFRAYTSSLNTTTSSILATIADIQLATSSIYYFSESINYYTASTTDLISGIQTATASLNAYTASNSFAVNSTSASFNRFSASIYTYTSSLNVITGSLYRQTASLLSYTASQNILNGTYATTGSNTFKGNQTVQGNFVVTGDIVAQQYIISSSQIYVTESFSSGSNIFGNSVDDYHVFTGSVLVSAGSNVGIGITNSTYQLHTAKTAQNYIAIDNTSDNTRLLLGAETNTTTLLSQNPSTLVPVDIKISAGTSEAMRITSGSRVGTGVYPTAKLHAATGSGDLFQLDGNNITKVFFVSASGDVTTSGSLFRVNAPIISGTGSAYIGGPVSASLFNGSGAGLISIPNSALVNSSFYVGTTSISLGRASSTQALTGITSIDGYSTALGGYSVNTVYTVLSPAANYNGPVIKVRYDTGTTNRYIDIGSIDGSGNYSEGLKLTNGTILTMNGYTVYHSGNIPTWNQNTTGTASNITAYTINQSVGSGNSPTFAGLLVNGAINATGDITAYYSDGRLKKDLQPIDNAVSKIMSLTGYTYYTNDLGKELLNITKDEKQVGLIAQDLQLVQPEAVKLAPFDKDENDESKSGENYLTIQYEKVVPLLIEAIKEQQLQIEELKLRL
jgi:hypothetical protein